MSSLLKGTCVVLLNLATLLLLLGLVLLIYDAFTHYLLSNPPIWMDELVHYLVTDAVMLMLDVAWIESGYMRTNLLKQRLLPRLMQVSRPYQ